jgi:SAM-dependent methyltransferase
MLDVGAAAGFILQGFMDAGWKGEGLEPNSSMAQHARQAMGLSVITGDLTSVPRDRQYDLVSMIQVIAHVVDPRQSLAKVSTILKPGGHLLIETWNSASLTARTMGKHWHEYSPPSVLHCFSISSLRSLLAEAEFCEVAHGRPSKWISAAHAQELLRYKCDDARWVERLAALIPARLSLPYPSEDLVWLLLKKKSVHHPKVANGPN